MANSLAEQQPAASPLSSAASLPTDSLLPRRITFHLERKPYSPISSSGARFNLETLNPSSSSPAVTKRDVEAPTPASGKRSDGGLDPELSFRITFRRIGAGLANIGNTCFLNSVLQCLTYTEPFAAYLQSGKHKSSCRTAGFCAMCALQNHVMNALQSTGKILAPSHLVKNLRCISRTFRNSRQEDAHEYMVNLLESMHKCCLPSGVPTESPSAYEKSLVHKIFGGRLRSQVQCMQCNFSSNKFDPFLDLSLEIMKADSLRKALAHFTHVEQLDGGERRYQCQRCKQKVRALKHLTIHKAPNVLTIHLKRFGCHIPGQKIDKKVEFGPTLDLKPFVSDQHEPDLKYTLYGVLVHAGWSTHSGHYYCFVRTSSGIWHSLDDNQVRQVSEKTVLAQKAYMLFYVRDRSSAIKGSTVIARKDNVPTHTPGNKVVPQSSSLFTEFVRNGMFERKSRISECDPAVGKPNDVSCGQPCSAVVDSLGDPLLKETSSSQKDISIPKEAPVLQSNGLVAKNTSCLQMTTKNQAKELMQEAVSKDHTKLPLKNPSTEMHLSISSIDHSSRLEHNNVAATSNAGNVVLPESRLVSHGKSQFPDVCDVKEESSILAAQLYTTGSLKSSSENQNNNFLKQTSIHVNDNAINEISQNNDAKCKMDTVSASASIEQTGVFNHSIHKNECIRKELFSPTLTETQITCPENGEIFCNLQHKKSGENLLKLEKAGLSKKLSSIPKRANVCLQEDCLSVIGIEDSVASHTKLKQNKFAKSRLTGPCFGRKQLFLKSLLVCKSKKDKRFRKHRFRKMAKYRVQEGTTADDHGKLTSEATRLIGEASSRSSKKRTRPSSNKEGIEGAKDNIVHDNDRILGKSSKNHVMLTTSEHPKNSAKPAAAQREARKEDAYEKQLAENNALSELMSFKQTIVPRWDDVDVPVYRGFEESESSIGYVLDEWDEEYDMGKKKKVKKSKQISGGPNPFQEFANMKIQQNMKMKVNRIHSGNQPLRI